MVTRRDGSGTELPSWIFDIDDEDDDITDKPLLQELEIDPQSILNNMLYNCLEPLNYICMRSSGNHPMLSAPQHLNSTSCTQSEQNVDFWGPCLVVSIYGAVLWLGNLHDVPWIYVVWSVSSIFNHFVCRSWLPSSKLIIHSALLGYSVAPIIPITGLIMLTRHIRWLVYILQAVAVAWAAAAATLSYSVIYRSSKNKRINRLALLMPPVVLMELYLISLMPID